MNPFKKNTQGFTMLEIVIVIILMGIIGVAAVPSISMIHKQEVKKLAQEMCLDLTSQRMKAMTTGMKHRIRLIEDTGMYHDYELLFLEDDTVSPEALTTQELKSHSKNIHVTMERLDKALNPTPVPVTQAQFDSYGFLTARAESEANFTEGYALQIVIQYDQVKAKIQFNCTTGNYNIEYIN